jgi:hypothetical protein
MGGYEVKFNVYANSQEEATRASVAIMHFISELAKQGIAVTADKISFAVDKYKDNYFVINYFRKNG